MKLNWFSFKNWNIAVQRADKIRHISAKHGGSIVASPPDVMESNRTDGKVIPNKEFLRWSTFSWKRLMWKRYKNRIAQNVLQRSPMMILFYFASVQRKSRHRNDAKIKASEVQMNSSKEKQRPLIYITISFLPSLDWQLYHNIASRQTRKNFREIVFLSKSLSTILIWKIGRSAWWVLTSWKSLNFNQAFEWKHRFGKRMNSCILT